MNRSDLLARLRASDPGWVEWKRLVALVESLRFRHVQDEYLGEYVTSGTRLTFSASSEPSWPSWMPPYVPALLGLKADEYEMAGGFAEAFSPTPTRRGQVFSPAGNDSALGYPVFRVPRGTYPFQESDAGALFHINAGHQVLYPDADKGALRVLDPLEAFARKGIVQALKGKRWIEAYPRLRDIID